MAFSSKALFGINRARAAASSANFNPRNLEFLWYPFWNRVASRIAAKIDIERCAVGPQYPLWRLWSEDEEDLGQIFIIADGTDNVDMEEAEDDDMEDTEDNTGDLGDITLSTINETLLDKARSRITDFALLYWIENARINVYRDDEADELFAIEREYIPILIEVKRAPSRKLEGNDRATKFNRLMFRAQEDVFRQALYFFTSSRWCHQQSIFVIAAVGDHWTYTVISRMQENGKEVVDGDSLENDPDWEPSLEEWKFEAVEWSPIAVWGKPADEVHVDTLFSWIEGHFLKVHK